MHNCRAITLHSTLGGAQCLVRELQTCGVRARRTLFILVAS